jgi:transcription elongation GreA/GreB family factor
MKSRFEIKKELYKACEDHVEKRLSTISKTFKSIEESRSNETKSSVGDKYETGRAMLQLEEEKSRRQLLEIRQVKNELGKIDLNRKAVEAELGSLVTTNKGEYYISIGIGKVKIEDGVFYCLSPGSPIGSKLLGKEVGDEIEFNGNKIEILEVT